MAVIARDLGISCSELCILDHVGLGTKQAGGALRCLLQVARAGGGVV
jgi:hypothetical protein